MKKLFLPAIFGATAVVATACGAGASLYGGSAASPGAATPTTGVALAVGNSNLRPLLVDGNGRSLYLFEADTTSASTYHGHPLYYYVGDAKPGDLVGQGLNQFGAAWYVLAPDGAKIDKS